MQKVLLYSLFLILGLALSQFAPLWVQGDCYSLFKTVINSLLYICLAYVMINVGREFELNKAGLKGYANDFFIAMGAASLPWLFIATYYIIVLLPPGYMVSWVAWKESLLLSMFSAPTSAGILLTMLIVCGLRKSWIYRKIQVLAIFDDLGTILLIIALQIVIVGLQWEMGIVLMIVFSLLFFGWRKMSSFNWRQEWYDILLYSTALHGATLALAHFLHVHVEVLLPAFILGMVMCHKETHSRYKRLAATLISLFFMLLVGLSMPSFGALSAMELPASTQADETTILGSQPMLSWGIIVVHVFAVTLLSNIGKLVPLFFYRQRSIEERLAVSIGMFIRGEVGAGIIFIAISNNIGGPALIISVLTLVFNLVLTGFFISKVKQLASKQKKIYV